MPDIPDNSDAIVFPDEYDEPIWPPVRRQHQRPPKPKAPKFVQSAAALSCPNETDKYCENVPDYPAEYIESQIDAELKKFEGLFGVDEVELESRFGDDDDNDEWKLCNSRQTIIFPKSGLTQENTWMFIVNSKNYVQGIRVEICE